MPMTPTHPSPRSRAAKLLPLSLLSLWLPGSAPVSAAAPGATPAQAQAFIDKTETELRPLWIQRERTKFVMDTFVTHDTEILGAQAEERVMEVTARKAREAHRFDGLSLPPDVARKLLLLKLSQTVPAPDNAAERAELAQIESWLESSYAKGKFCPPGAPCQTLDDLSRTLAQSHDYDKLLGAWTGWHTISRPMRQKYERYVVLGNKGARELGYPDLGALWRAGYDMQPEEFRAEAERLWGQVEPLYKALHCHVRARLHEKYGARVPETGPIPAHVLGNMWAQEWGNIFPLVAPVQQVAHPDLKARLLAKGTKALDMVKYGENFFVSLGLDPLPRTFWERSMFVRPRDREVMCHASAWDIELNGDLRLKMCIEIDAENFQTVHHELGHDYYYWAYRDLPLLFQTGAHDGFHEAIGDTMALSITPSYLTKVGLLDQAPKEGPEADIAFLLERALDGIVFLPFGKLIDQWRWDVFAGKIKPGEYNKAWWEMRRRYQGIAPPVQRSEADFDPGAKYHIAGSTPYVRYFLARILQYQFHRALCQAAGHKGPLHQCSIYGNKAAGERLKALLAMGASKPWQDAMNAIAGVRQMDAGALIEYYKPLLDWLDRQNQGRRCGW